MAKMRRDRIDRTPLIHVVDARDDDDHARVRRYDIAIEARQDLIAALAVDATIEDVPVRMRPHQPVCVLALLVPATRRRRFDRTPPPGCTGSGGVTQGDDS